MFKIVIFDVNSYAVIKETLLFEPKDIRVGMLTHNNVEQRVLTKEDVVHLLTDDNIHYANPVKIYRQWLLDNGFQYHENNWYKLRYFSDCPLAVEIFTISYNIKTGRTAINDDDEEGVHVFTGKELKFVHDMQNFLDVMTGGQLILDKDHEIKHVYTVPGDKEHKPL